MRGFQSIIIAGNVGKDPETRTTHTGMLVANISVGVGGRKKEHGEWVDHTEWFRVVAFDKTAEVIQKYVRKGSPILVRGRIETEKWEDKDGNDRYTAKLYANDVTLLGNRGDGDEGGERYQRPAAAPPRAQKPETQSAEEPFEDDIPF